MKNKTKFVSMIDTSRGINWAPASFIIGYQALLLLLLPFYFYWTPPGLGLSVFSLILFFITGISITAGYHRYFSHRTFKTNPVVETILLFFASMAAQGSALRWSFDHRVHHAFVDTDDDPYSIKKGFWYAHFLWILEKPKPINKKVVADLVRNPRVMFQENHYFFLMIFTNILVLFTAGLLFSDFIGALVVAVFLRMFVLHHFTWFINSLAHTWGDKPFCQEQTAVDNYLISLVTFGEGYHNYHHTYASDYRNGIRWYHFDPTKWTIWLLNKLKLAKGLKRMDAFTIDQRMVLERKELLLDKVKDLLSLKKEEFERSIQDVSERMLHQIAEFKKLMETYNRMKEGTEERVLLAKLKDEIYCLKKQLRSDWKVWQQLSRKILQFSPA